MKIAICDDELKDIEHLRKSVLAHSDIHEIIEFLSVKPFLERIYSGEHFDLLFLDVQMPDSDGWEIAKALKQARHKIFIAMVTVHGEYIFDCFDRVDWFAPKPVSNEKVAQILDKATEKLFPKAFEFQTEKLMISLTAPEIIYFEVRRNTLDVYSTQGCHEVRLSLKKVKETLADYQQFAQTHGSIIINLDFYNGVKDGYITLSSGHEVKLSRTFRNSFFEALSAYVRSS